MRALLIVLLACVLLSAGIQTHAQRSILPTEYNLPYAAETDRFRLLDLYTPEAGEAPYPVVLMFHGSPGAKGDLVSYGIPQIVVGEGYAAIPVEYTTGLPAAYNDAFCALAWVYANAETYQLDSSRIALFGVSYGGLVVAGMSAIDDPALFLTDCSQTLPAEYEFSGVIGDAGVYDASVEGILGYMEEMLGATEPTIGEIGSRLRETPPTEWRDLDLPEAVSALLVNYPVYWVNGGEPPHLLIHGLGDSNVPYQQALDYADVLTQHRVSVQLVLDRLSGHVPPPRIFDREMATFLHRIFD